MKIMQQGVCFPLQEISVVTGRLPYHLRLEYAGNDTGKTESRVKDTLYYVYNNEGDNAIIIACRIWQEH